MIEQIPTDNTMVAMQLTTDEGAFICNVKAGDIVKMSARESGVSFVIYCAIRLDMMSEGQYELYRTKKIDASSVDSYRSFEKTRHTLRKKAAHRAMR
jgi:hypothetical protein